MNSKEIILRCLEFRAPERIGLDFVPPHESDICWVNTTRFYDDQHSTGWGRHPHLLEKVPGFNGDVMMDVYGVIHGRLDSFTKGEPVWGPLQDSWDLLDGYAFPMLDPTPDAAVQEWIRENGDRFLVSSIGSPFSIMRNLRRLENLFMDMAAQPEYVKALAERVFAFDSLQIEQAAREGVDAVIIADDWGTQTSLFVSPKMWRRQFGPLYAALVEKAHGLGVKFLVHSCGYVYDIAGDWVEMGVDAFQFDQPGLLGVERLARDFGGRVTFWCPVDIQKVMPTGSRAQIEAEARKLIQAFGSYGGGLIAKDYPQWEAIGVQDEWAEWARAVFRAG